MKPPSHAGMSWDDDLGSASTQGRCLGDMLFTHHIMLLVRPRISIYAFFSSVGITVSKHPLDCHPLNMVIDHLVKRLKRRHPSVKSWNHHPLLRSNDPPDEQQALEIWEAIRSLSARYEESTGHLWSPQPTASGTSNDELLQQEVVDLDAQIRALHSIVSCIRRVPEEILQKIMLFAATPDYPNRISVGRIHFIVRSRDAYLFASVCRRWRQAAQGAHTLWQLLPSICLCDNRHRMYVKDIYSLMNLTLPAHLKRSGSLPLIFRVCQSHQNASAWGRRAQIWRLVWKLFQENAGRWGTAIIFGSYKLFQGLQKDDSGKRFEQLTDLEIQFDHPWGGPGPIVIDSFAEAPNLRNASFSSPAMTSVESNPPMVTLSLPWHQLERYSTEGGGDNSLDSILRVNPEGLIYLRSVVTNLYVNLPEQRITMHRLQVLRLHVYNGASQLAALVNHLELPSLTELELRGRFLQVDALFKKVRSLVIRSNCSLRKLELDDGDTDVEAFRRLLAVTPTLEHLDISRPPSEILASLILYPSSLDPVLPNLTSLTIEIGTPSSISGGELQEGQLDYACDFDVLRALLKSRMDLIETQSDPFSASNDVKRLVEARFSCRNWSDDIAIVWDFQAKLEGPSTVPGLSNERLREWAVWMKDKISPNRRSKTKFSNARFRLAVQQFLGQLEKFNVDSDAMRLLCVGCRSLSLQEMWGLTCGHLESRHPPDAARRNHCPVTQHPRSPSLALERRGDKYSQQVGAHLQEFLSKVASTLAL